MKILSVAIACWLLAACTTTPTVPAYQRLFNDQLFEAPAQPVTASELFTLSPAMKSYTKAEISGLHGPGLQQQLVDALYSKGQLRLEYDAALTRNASQAFDARAGNCLSLVIMTAAFAKHLGLTVRYQQVINGDAWGRSGDTMLAIAHVNLTLARKPARGSIDHNDVDPLQVDFLPPPAARGMRLRPLTEETIVAMYMNNRAVELLTQGQVNDAYWWARAAVSQDASYMTSYNTLAVAYQRRGHFEQAATVLVQVLDREPGNTQAMTNLARVYAVMGRESESLALGLRLAQLEPNPPFSYYYRGLAALRAGDTLVARDLFAKEVDRAGYYHEFHFWLGMSYLQLGQNESAVKHLAIAQERSTTRDDRQLYASKLQLMKSGALQPSPLRQ